MYAFLFDKRSLGLLVVVMIVLGALLFGGGFLLGVQWGLPTSADELVARQTSVEAARPAPPALPVSTEPVTTEPTSTEPISIEPLSTEPVDPQPPALGAPASDPAALDATPIAPPPASPATASPAPQSEIPAASAPAPAAPAPEALPVPTAAPVATAAAVPTARPQAAPAAGDPAFSLQVGAFARRENCDAVVQELAGRGYQPYVVDLASRRSRVLHAVRIGRYEDLASATQAAADFRHREGQPAVVLPPGS